MVRMKPWEKAKQWQEENSEVPFEKVLSAYLSDGYVWSSPTEFILATASYWDGKDMHVGKGKENCWIIQLAAGDEPGERFFKVVPHKLDYLSWQRRGNDKWHVWDWDKFEKKIRRTKNG